MKIVTYDKSFAVHVPLLWNELQAIVRLSDSLSLFNSRLQTHLFKLSFKSQPCNQFAPNFYSLYCKLGYLLFLKLCSS